MWPVNLVSSSLKHVQKQTTALSRPDVLCPFLPSRSASHIYFFCNSKCHCSTLANPVVHFHCQAGNENNQLSKFFLLFSSFPLSGNGNNVDCVSSTRSINWLICPSCLVGIRLSSLETSTLSLSWYLTQRRPCWCFFIQHMGRAAITCQTTVLLNMHCEDESVFVMLLPITNKHVMHAQTKRDLYATAIIVICYSIN